MRVAERGAPTRGSNVFFFAGPVRGPGPRQLVRPLRRPRRGGGGRPHQPRAAEAHAVAVAEATEGWVLGLGRKRFMFFEGAL